MDDGRGLLAGIVGEWEGTYRLWLEPAKVHTECASRLAASELLGGQFVLAQYDWAAGAGGTDGGTGDPQSGAYLLGRNGEGIWQMAFVDTWHNGTSMMWSTGGPEPRLTGSYPTGAEPWSWRTEFDLRSANHLVITAYNISPGGDEERATEAEYRRV